MEKSSNAEHWDNNKGVEHKLKQDMDCENDKSVVIQ